MREVRGSRSPKRFTITDQVLKKTHDVIVRKRDEFIDLMVADDTLRSEAVEDDDEGERRKKL